MDSIVVQSSEEGLALLAEYREVMNEQQLERYGEYLLRKSPLNPFSLAEIEILRKKKQWKIHQAMLHLKIKDVHREATRCQESFIQAKTLLQRAAQLSRSMHFNGYTADDKLQEAV